MALTFFYLFVFAFVWRAPACPWRGGQCTVSLRRANSSCRLAGRLRYLRNWGLAPGRIYEVAGTAARHDYAIFFDVMYIIDSRQSPEFWHQVRVSPSDDEYRLRRSPLFLNTANNCRYYITFCCVPICKQFWCTVKQCRRRKLISGNKRSYQSRPVAADIHYTPDTLCKVEHCGFTIIHGGT